MPARARTPQDPPAAAGTTARKPGARPPATKPPAGGENERTALDTRVRVLEETVNALLATAAANQKAVHSFLRHIDEIAFERLVPPPPPPPPIKPRQNRPR